MGDLPPVGFKATVEDIEKFKRDVRSFNASMDSVEKATADVTSKQKDMGSDLGALPASFQRVQAKAKSLATETAGLGTRIQALNSGLVGTGAATGTAVEGLMGVAAAAGIVVGVVGAVVGGIKMGLDALERVEPLWQARDAYAALSHQVGITSDTIVRETQRMSGFTVSEYKIITDSNRDLLAGNKALAQAYPQLMELAATTAAALGTSVEAQFDKITGAIRSGSQSALEAAGIWMEIESAQQDYAEQSDRTIEQLNEEERLLLALEVVLKEYPGYIEDMGGAAESAMTPINELKTEIGLLKDEMLAAIGTGFLGFLDAMGIKLPNITAAIADWRTGGDTRTAFAELNRIAMERLREGGITQEFYSQLRNLSMFGGPQGLSKEDSIAVMRSLLGLAPGEAGVSGPSVSGPSASSRWTIPPEDAADAALRAATAESLKEDRKKLREKMEADIAKKAASLAPYLSFEGTEDARKRMLSDLETFLELWPDAVGPRAAYALELMTSAWDDNASAIRKAGRATEFSTSKLREMNKYLLYTAGGGVGGWAQAFAQEHGGQSPLQKYRKHEDPLQAALIDKAWGDTFAAEKGRAPTDAEWQAHWYEQWAPLELYPGGPIAKATGTLADIIDKMIADDNLGGLDDVFHDAYMETLDLVPQLTAVKTESEILADFTSATLTPTMETLATEAANAAAELAKVGKDKPPDDETPPPPPPGSEDPKSGTGASIGEDPTIFRRGDETFKLNPETGFYEFVESLQRGGLTQRGGLYMLHANELVLPLDKLADMTSMRMGGSSGGLSIQQLNIPVTINGGAGPGVATEIQNALNNSIRGSAGRELLRASRRLGS